MSGESQRNSIVKTTKLFINGQFPRTESGRSQPVTIANSSEVLTNICQASRKDLRKAVDSAGAALAGWGKRSAYNRAQILYRMAEMLEGRKGEFQSLLQKAMGVSVSSATDSVEAAVDSLVYYAGFADKFSQVMASVNPVSGPYHNFTTPEPVGVVGLVDQSPFDFKKWVSQMASVICSGNTAVIIFEKPGAALLSEMGEVLQSSDLPAGVVNLLSGSVAELYPVLAGHMEVHSVLYSGVDAQVLSDIKELATQNMKRVVTWNFEACDLAPITAFTEYKTIWHPVGV